MTVAIGTTLLSGCSPATDSPKDQHLTFVYNFATLSLDPHRDSSYVPLRAGGTVTFAEGEDWVRGREIGYIPQHYQQSFVPFLTIKETMRDLCRAHHVAYDTEQTESLLRSFRLDIDLLDRLPHQLSGGQLQRMAIILAVFLKPRLLLADELTTALDPVATRQLLDWLRNYQLQTAATVLFVTHELTHALHYADTLYIMKEGTIIDAFTPETIHASRHPYTQALYTNRH